MTQPIPQATISPLSTYEKFLECEQIPVIKGFHIDDLNTVPVEPWERKGAFGTYIYLDGTGGVADCYVCEIPPSGSIKPQRHLIEEIIYILKGRGLRRCGGTEVRNILLSGKREVSSLHPLTPGIRCLMGREIALFDLSLIRTHHW